MGSCREREVMPAAGINIVRVNQPSACRFAASYASSLPAISSIFAVTNALIDPLA